VRTGYNSFEWRNWNTQADESHAKSDDLNPAAFLWAGRPMGVRVPSQ